MKLKLDPRQRLKQWVNGEVVVTNEPMEYPDHVVELLLQSRRNGLPLVTEVEDEETAQPWSMSATTTSHELEDLSSDDEDAEAEVEISDDDE